MDEVRSNIVEHALIVGDEQNTEIRTGQRVDTLGDYFEGVDVETRVCFVHDGNLWLKQGHLQNLGTLLLTARKAIIDRAVDKAVIDFEQFHLLLQELAELSGWNALALRHFPSWVFSLCQGLVAFAYRLKGSAQEVCHAHARNRHWILESQEETHASAAV